MDSSQEEKSVTLQSTTSLGFFIRKICKKGEVKKLSNVPFLGGLPTCVSAEVPEGGGGGVQLRDARRMDPLLFLPPRGFPAGCCPSQSLCPLFCPLSSTRLAMLSSNLMHWKKLPPLPSLTNQPHQVLASDPVPFADLQQVGYSGK